MHVWSLADLHLSFGVPEKSMEIFGPEWENYAEKIRSQWLEMIAPEDLVLIPGDISWAMSLEVALVDLKWIDQLPGTKLLIKGNHDYWWSSLSKVREALPPSIHVIQNDAFTFQGVSVAGTRLWDTEAYSFDHLIAFKERPISKEKESDRDREKIFTRELSRLELSLKALDSKAPLRIAMTHYPPIGTDLAPSKVSELLEAYGVQLCVFGHLHSIKKELQGKELFGTARGVCYHLVSGDFLGFTPLKLV